MCESPAVVCLSVIVRAGDRQTGARAFWVSACSVRNPKGPCAVLSHMEGGTGVERVWGKIGMGSAQWWANCLRLVSTLCNMSDQNIPEEKWWSIESFHRWRGSNSTSVFGPSVFSETKIQRMFFLCAINQWITSKFWINKFKTAC